MKTFPLLSTLVLLGLSAPAMGLGLSAADCGASIFHDPNTFQPGHLSKTIDRTPLIRVGFVDDPEHCGIDSYYMTLDDLNDANAPYQIYVETESSAGYYYLYSHITGALPPSTYQVVAQIRESGSGATDIVAWNFQVVVACDDGLDNDGDGLNDFPNDPGCSSATDANERGAAAACDDGTDNDGDGRADYPSDPGCSSPHDVDETITCAPAVPDVVVCLAHVPDRVVRIPLPVEGSEHSVWGYVEVFTIRVPLVGSVNVPCVRVIVDGQPTNPCDEIGTYQSTIYALSRITVAEPSFSDDQLALCTAELRATAFNVGVNNLSLLVPC